MLGEARTKVRPYKRELRHDLRLRGAAVRNLRARMTTGQRRWRRSVWGNLGRGFREIGKLADETVPERGVAFDGREQMRHQLE